MNDLERLEQEYRYLKGYQESMKLVINSFYGAMGAPHVNFNDFESAALVTIKGRECVNKIAETIEQLGGIVLEVDTDGVFAIPPAHIVGEDAEEKFIAQVGSIALPSALSLAFDGRYKKMISVKAKNYVLEEYGGRLIFKGNSLKSRSSEEFGKRFLKEVIRMLIDENRVGVQTLYATYLRSIVTGEFGVLEYQRRERITEATKVSPAKKRIRAIAGSLKIGEYVYVYDRSDGTLALAEDYGNDEDTMKYLKKLHAYISRLSTLFTEEEFKTWFPKPGVRWLKAYKEALNV